MRKRRFTPLVAKAVPMPGSLKDYWNQLNSHDWYYDFSEDPGVLAKGRARESTLERAARLGPDYKALYVAFKNHAFSGESFGRPQAPKPPEPQ